MIDTRSNDVGIFDLLIVHTKGKIICEYMNKICEHMNSVSSRLFTKCSPIVKYRVLSHFVNSQPEKLNILYSNDNEERRLKRIFDLRLKQIFDLQLLKGIFDLRSLKCVPVEFVGKNNTFRRPEVQESKQLLSTILSNLISFKHHKLNL